MIDSFLRNRSDTLKRVSSTQHKESKFVEEVKKTIELEKQKSKNSGLAEIEKEYKDKAEKLLMIVKQEAARIDGKLVDLQGENARLKSSLSEMKVLAVDIKLRREVYNIEQVLNELRVRTGDGDLESDKIRKLIELKGMVYDGSLDQEICEIVGDDEMICYPISEVILAKKLEWDGRIRGLEQEIECRRVRYQGLDQEIKGFWMRRREELCEEEEFGTRETRSDTFGNVPQTVFLGAGNGGSAVSLSLQSPPDLQTTVNNLLGQVFSELILEIEASTLISNSE